MTNTPKFTAKITSIHIYDAGSCSASHLSFVQRLKAIVANGGGGGGAAAAAAAADLTSGDGGHTLRAPIVRALFANFHSVEVTTQPGDAACASGDAVVSTGAARNQCVFRSATYAHATSPTQNPLRETFVLFLDSGDLLAPQRNAIGTLLSVAHKTNAQVVTSPEYFISYYNIRKNNRV